MPAIIGVDESGKGDFFGPLVVAALLADDVEIPILTKLGARDSKLVADKKLLSIDQELRSRYPHVVLVLPPEQYNSRYSKIKNLNRMLAECHAEVIARLTREHKADHAISDRFGKPELIEGALARAGCTIGITQVVRGESIPQVAAASMLARAAFLREMEALSEEYSITLPLGAGPVVDKAGREAVKRLGPQILNKIAKTHFKNYQRAITPSLF
ncbi:MAG TPA: ribonuclease HIII [Candidatus Acidoferrum sp.]|nr:ribonuclease HIII [Candidatus Acidoferrum sp.]